MKKNKNIFYYLTFWFLHFFIKNIIKKISNFFIIFFVTKKKISSRLTFGYELSRRSLSILKLKLIFNKIFVLNDKLL